jgi:type I restriction-modification system DNA methylase subunit
MCDVVDLDTGAAPVLVSLASGHGGAKVAVMASGPTHQRMAADIWSVVDLLRGDYRRTEYGHVILPFTVLRRLDAVLSIQGQQRSPELPFRNTSGLDFAAIASDASAVAKNLRDYINGFSPNVRRIIDRFGLDGQIARLAGARLLYRVVGRFAAMHDLDKLSTHDMGYVFEHLIRKFYEDANGEAGDHFTPREVIDLMVNLLIAPDMDTILSEGRVISILDPACGTGGMLTSARTRHQSERTGLPLRPGVQRGIVGDVRVGDAAARPAREHRLRQFLRRGWLFRPEIRLPAGQPAVRRGVEKGQGGG